MQELRLLPIRAGGPGRTPSKSLARRGKLPLARIPSPAISRRVRVSWLARGRGQEVKACPCGLSDLPCRALGSVLVSSAKAVSLTMTASHAYAFAITRRHRFEPRARPSPSCLPRSLCRRCLFISRPPAHPERLTVSRAHVRLPTALAISTGENAGSAHSNQTNRSLNLGGRGDAGLGKAVKYRA